MKRLFYTAIVALIFTPVCSAADTAEARAKRLAEETLSTVVDADQALAVALQEGNDQAFRERVILPLERVQVRWQQAPHMTDLVKATHGDCRTAASELHGIALALARGDSEWATYKRDDYRESLEFCRESIQFPERFAIN